MQNHRLKLNLVKNMDEIFKTLLEHASYDVFKDYQKVERRADVLWLNSIKS